MREAAQWKSTNFQDVHAINWWRDNTNFFDYYSSSFKILKQIINQLVSKMWSFHLKYLNDNWTEMKRKIIEKIAKKNNSNMPMCFKNKEENLFIMNL